MHTATKKTAMNTSQSHSYSNFNGTHSSNSLLLKGQCHEIFDHFLFVTKNSAYSIYEHSNTVSRNYFRFNEDFAKNVCGGHTNLELIDRISSRKRNLVCLFIWGPCRVF